MAKLYCIATNTGSGFITHSEQENESPLNAIGYPGNVWCVEDNDTGEAWVSKVGGVSKTKAEAQEIVDDKVEEAQEIWDNRPEPKYPQERPVKYTLD